MKNPQKKSLQNLTRLFTLLGSIALIVVIFVPIWKIELDAPQYPEGLEMYIHADKVSGDVEIINGLNHYIGMKEIHEDEFVEFKVLPYILMAIAALGVLAAVVNRKWLFYIWGIIFVLFAVLAMVDFYMWLHDYGHNLDPHAAIQVPGMTYQPPLLGFKQLLNFGAYSIPSTGGWLMALVGVIIAFFSYIEITGKKLFS